MGWNINRALVQPLAHIPHEPIMPAHCNKKESAMTRPLSGITVLELGNLLAGSFCGMLLGDMGADVIKIEPRRFGDMIRNTSPHIKGESANYIAINRNKREGLLYQDIDIAQCVEPKQFHDVVGYYNRFDVFDLKITRKRLSPIQFLELRSEICPRTRRIDADSHEPSRLP